MKAKQAFWLSVLLLFAVSAAIFAPALLGGKMLWGADIQTLEFPFKIAAQRSLALGEWPLWMPELLGGMPGIAASNLVFLYPSEFLISLLRLPPHMGFGLDSALQVFLAGLGMLLFLRRLGLSPAASLLGALFYALSGTQVSLLYAGHINNIKAYAMIPWVFWASHKGFYERSLFAWGLCGAALALQILGIGMQVFAYTILGLGAYVAWMAWIEKGKSWQWAALGLGVAALFTILLSAPQLWLSLEYKPHSWREGFSYESFTSWSFHPKEALGWIVPGYYGWREPTYHGDWQFCLTTEYFGILPWVLAAAAGVAYWGGGALRKGDGACSPLGTRGADAVSTTKFWIGLVVVSFLIGIGKWTPIHHLFYRLPVYSGFRTWTRFLCLLTFAVSVLAAMGWDALWVGERRRQALKGALYFCTFAALLAMIAMGSAVASKPGALEIARASAGKALLLSIGLAGFCLAASRKLALGLGIAVALGLHVFDSSEMIRRYVEFKPPSQFTARPSFLAGLPANDQPEPWRMISLPGVWDQNASVIHGYEDLLGYHGVQMAAPMKLQNAMQARQLDWLSLMNVNFILSTGELAGLPLLQNGSVKIYRNPMALPRAFLVAKARRVADEDAAVKALADPAFIPSREVLVTEDVTLPGGEAKGRVSWLKRSRNGFELEVEALQPSVLVISNFWYPAWKAELDGKSVPLSKVDGVLQGVVLGPGKHHLKLFYSAKLLWAAVIAFVLGITGLFGLLRNRSSTLR